MDPISTATTFATIVGLIGNFSAEKRNAASATYEEFMEWLAKSNHDELVKLISEGNATSIGIKALFNESQEELISRLQNLDASIAQLATGFEGFRDIALSIYPDSELSEQAISVIEQFCDSGAIKVNSTSYIGGELKLTIVEGSSGNISYTDRRFIEDDLNTLVHIGLLRMDFTKGGIPLYLITRNAIRFIENRRRNA